MDKHLEELAALEHEQWAHWTKYMLENLTDEDIERWKKQIQTPYSELSEKEKESDRKWARKVFTLLDGLNCKGCFHEEEGAYEHPCVVCSRPAIDHYTPK